MYRPPETGRGIQGAIRQLCDETGVASIAREIGFIDEAGEIGELRQYDGIDAILLVSEPTRTGHAGSRQCSQSQEKGARQ